MTTSNIALANDASDAEAATFKKITYRIVPFILILYFICYIDRVNIGFAKLQFLTDIGLTEAHYGFAAGLFYVTYSLFDLPSNMMLARIGVRKTLLRIMVLWGFVSGAQMFIRSAIDLYVLRLIFGAAEAGFLPGIMLYLTFWFPSKYRARITALFFAGVPVSAIIGAPLSGIVMQHMNDVFGLRGWQWLFMLFAVPAIAFGIIAYFYLDEKPEDARWLDDREKALVAEKLAAERASQPHSRHGSFRGVLRDPRLYAMAALNFAANTASNTATFWMPTILKEVGVRNVTDIGYITGSVSVVAAIGMLLVARNSDRFQERRWHYAACAALTALAYGLLPLAADSLYGTIALLTCAATGGISLLVVYWTIPTTYLTGRAAAGGIGFVSMIGAAGSAVSPSLIGWLQRTTGSLYVGLWSTTIIVMIGATIVLLAMPSNAKSISTHGSDA